MLTVALGNGWWRGRLGFLGGRALYGDRLGLIAQLEVTYADGHAQVIGTDASWTAEPSDTIADDLYDGQTIDARRRPQDQTQPDWNDQSLAAVPVEFDTSVLVPAIGPPVVRHETRQPERIWTLTVRGDARRLRPEPGGLAAVRRAGAARLGDPDPACGGAGGGRARRTPAA